MSAELETKILDLIDSGNYDEIKKLPLEDRLKLIDPKNLVAKILIDKLENTDFALITELETIYLYNHREELKFDITAHSINPLIKYHYSLQSFFMDQYLLVGFDNYLRAIRNSKLQWELVQKIGNDFDRIEFEYLNDDVLDRLMYDKKWKNHLYNILAAFKNDEYREKFIHGLTGEAKQYAIETLKSDELREKYINEVPANRRGSIIIRFQNPETRKKYLSGLTDLKATIISYMETDEEKMDYLDQYRLVLSQEEKGKIIAHLSDMDNIKKYISEITKPKGLLSFFRSFDVNRDLEFAKQLLEYAQHPDAISNLWGVIRSANDSFDEYFINRVDNQKALYDMLGGITRKQEKLIAKKLDSENASKYLKSRKEDSEIWIFARCNDEKLVFQTIEHANFSTPYEEEYRPLVEMVAKHYNVSFEHLLELTKLTDCHVLNFMNNENIIEALKLSDEDFNKYLRLFDKNNCDMNMSTISTMVTTLGHKAFGIENPGDVYIFINTLHDVDDNKIDEAIAKIRTVYDSIDASKYNIDIDTLISGILAKNSDTRKIYNAMTYDYLTVKRNEYLAKNADSFLSACTTPEYEKNAMIRYCFKHFDLENLRSIFEAYSYYIRNAEIEVKSLYENKPLIDQLIQFKKDPNSFGPLTAEMKAALRPFGEICAVIFKHYLSAYNRIAGIPVEYENPPIKGELLVTLMANIDMDKFKDTLLTNDELYEDLLGRLDKYDMVGWGSRFSKLSEQADIDVDSMLVGGYISNYSLISQKRKEMIENNQRFTFMSELNLTDCLDSDANIFATLIGQEDYRLIRRNPHPNPSPAKKKDRIKEAVVCLKKMHNRKSITVPPVDENVLLRSGKKINIKIGNTNDTINLTYGERTGACMRLGGAGKTLFHFCLNDENGFHMSFNDPNTGELISRVSCFRNGNTVCLNQLRDPIKSTYSNEDVVEACKILCNKIIEMTKNSRHPIENVIASGDYALYNEPVKTFDCKNIKKGLPNFYCDIKEGGAVVMATKDNGPLREIKPNPGAAERYPIGRANVKKFELKKAIGAVKHIEALDLFYGGCSIDKIELEDKPVSVAYTGEDWYVALTNDGEIISYMQKNSLNKTAARLEMEEYIKVLESIKKYGGMVL